MDTGAFVTLAAGLLAYAIFSRSLAAIWLSPPMAFTAFGLIVGPFMLGIVPFSADTELVRVIAEVTLVLVLFTDAARTDLRQLRRDHSIPIRLLVIGLPLSIVLGMVAAALMFPELGLVAAALIAAVLAPTDAALGQAVVSDQRVPARIRQALNVESGLNDGIVLPVVLILAAAAGAAHQDAGSIGFWVKFIGLQLVLGPLIGAAVGVAGGRIIDWAATRGRMANAFHGPSALGLAGLSFAVAEVAGGNGFIAAFVGGLAFGANTRHPCAALFEFAEAEGQLLVLTTFTIFGAIMLPIALAETDARILLYAVLSLTVIRILPAVVSLLGSGLRPATHLFLGWFGPRGLASILFALIVVEEVALADAGRFQAIVFWTVTMSIVAHGITAAPAAAWYGARAIAMRQARPDCPEASAVSELPTRVFAGPKRPAGS